MTGGRNASARQATHSNGISLTRAGASPPSQRTVTSVPGSTSRRTIARAIGPSRGDTTLLLTSPTELSPVEKLRAPWKRHRALQAAQAPVHVATKVHSRHGLLPRVAPFRERDAVQRVEICLLREGVGVHVDPPQRPARLDPRDVRRGAADGSRMRVHEARPERLGGSHRDEAIESFAAEVGDARHQHARAGDLERDVMIVRQPAQRRDPRRRRALALKYRRQHRVRARPEEAECPQRRAHVHVLREPRIDVLPEHRRESGPRVRRHVEEEIVRACEDPHVRDHLALRGQCRGVLPRAGLQGAHVVGQEPGERLPGLRSTEHEPEALTSIDEPGTSAQRGVLGLDRRENRLRMHRLAQRSAA